MTAINNVPVRDNLTVLPQGTPERGRTISICETQPVTAEGLRTLLSGCVDLRFSEATDSLNRAMDLVRHSAPDVLLIDKAFGMQAILEWLGERESGQVDIREPQDTAPFNGLDGVRENRPGIVIWGVSVTEAEALRFLQAGARGILRKTADWRRCSPVCARWQPDEAGWRTACSAISRGPNDILAAS